MHNVPIMSTEIKVGSILSDSFGEARVMAIGDGYLMVRRPRCFPFVLKASDVGKRWRLVEIINP